MKRHVLATERLIIRELPGRAARSVASFISGSWDFHRKWEPYRHPSYFRTRSIRGRLRIIDRSQTDHAFWLYERETRFGLRPPVPIGSITLSSIVRGALQSCFLGYKMDPRYLRRGYMREAVECVLAFAYDELGLHRIEANVMPSNAASLGLLRQLGFQEEGVARRYLLIQGRWEDHVHMVLLREEWESRP